MNIPQPLSAHYQIATSHDVRSWSFGAVTAARNPEADFQDHVQGTLHDQQIFGSVRDFECYCGQYAGERYAGMICDRCGVKIAPSSVRASRFGHIEFLEPIRHPFAADTELGCFPVLPIHFAQSPGGTALAALYDRLAESSTRDESEGTVGEIVELLTPVVILLSEWQIDPVRTLARGLALQQKSAQSPLP